MYQVECSLCLSVCLRHTLQCVPGRMFTMFVHLSMTYTAVCTRQNVHYVCPSVYHIHCMFTMFVHLSTTYTAVCTRQNVHYVCPSVYHIHCSVYQVECSLCLSVCLPHTLQCVPGRMFTMSVSVCLPHTLQCVPGRMFTMSVRLSTTYTAVCTR